MKKLFILILILTSLFAVTVLAAEPVEFTLSISSGVTTGTGASGVTTLAAQSGPSYMIEGYTIKRISGHDGYFAVQAKTLTAAETAGAASGATFTFSYKASLENNDTAWNAAQTIKVIDSLALSGNTLYRYSFYPEFCNYMRFYFDSSGKTPYSAAEFKLSIK